MEFYYGIPPTYLDVTEKVHHLLDNLDTCTIPSTDDERCTWFGDPHFGVVKHIIYRTTTGYHILPAGRELTLSSKDFVEERKLARLQRRLRLSFGSFVDEYPEQLLSVRYIAPTATVLELGGNIGRNSCIIASLLTNSERLLVLEPQPDIAKQLLINRDNNKLAFHVEVAAISEHPLVQKGWITKIPDASTTDWTPITTITYPELCKKYPWSFDTLVVDCEGAFPGIVRSYPDILTNINLIILENDGGDEEGLYKDLVAHNFVQVYSQHLGSRRNFFQVWKLSL